MPRGSPPLGFETLTSVAPEAPDPRVSLSIWIEIDLRKYALNLAREDADEVSPVMVLAEQYFQFLIPHQLSVEAEAE